MNLSIVRSMPLSIQYFTSLLPLKWEAEGKYLSIDDTPRKPNLFASWERMWNCGKIADSCEE